jgi:hypothetical protein
MIRASENLHLVDRAVIVRIKGAERGEAPRAKDTSILAVGVPCSFGSISPWSFTAAALVSDHPSWSCDDIATISCHNELPELLLVQTSNARYRWFKNDTALDQHALVLSLVIGSLSAFLMVFFTLRICRIEIEPSLQKY